MKKVLKYSLRVLLYTIISALLYIKTRELIADILTVIYRIICPGTSEEDYTALQILFTFIVGMIMVYTVLIGITYFFAKICGLFKGLDNLKKWQSILILIFIGIFIDKFSDFLDKYEEIVALDIRIGISCAGHGLVPSYLTYLFLNYMTKKYPKYLTKIGYYTSINFFKDLFNRLKNICKRKF